MGRITLLGAGASSAATPWWLAGDIDPANRVAAYQAIGAASLAASYVNLANPGTYDCTTPSAPTWNATDGWIGNGSNQRLDTGIVPVLDGTWSAFVRVTNLTFNLKPVFGIYRAGGAKYFVFIINYLADRMYFGNGDELSMDWTPGKTSGVFGFSGKKLYIDGVEQAFTIGGSSVANAVSIPILASTDDGVIFDYVSGSVQAAVFYNTSITKLQAETVCARMAALP